MTSLIHIATGFDALLAWLSAAWLGFSELITISAILLMLDKLAGAVRATFIAGRFTRRLVDATLIPAADALSWIIARIDWRLVLDVVVDCLKVLLALTITAISWTRENLIAAHERHVGVIEWTAPTPAVAPMVHPLAMLADEMTELSCNTIRREFGLRAKTSNRRPPFKVR